VEAVVVTTDKPMQVEAEAVAQPVWVCPKAAVVCPKAVAVCPKEALKLEEEDPKAKEEGLKVVEEVRKEVEEERPKREGLCLPLRHSLSSRHDLL